MAIRDPMDDRVDDTLAASFPASDPPSWTLGAPAWATSSVLQEENEDVGLRRLRGDHGNLTDLALVLESLLARLHEGEAVDHALLVDVLDYVTDYLDRLHEGRDHRVFDAIVARIPIAGALRPLARAHAAEETAAREALRSELARRDTTTEGIVHMGFAYTRALRKRIAWEDSVLLPLARLASESGAGAVDRLPAVWNDLQSFEEHYRARFDELTGRVGCGCAFEKE